MNKKPRKRRQNSIERMLAPTPQEVAESRIPAEILNAPVLFGLRAQGHIPTIERMLAEGKSWDVIGDVIGWCGETAQRHYGWHLEAKAKENK